MAGAVVFLIFAVGTLTQLPASRFDNRRVVLAGLGLFLAALALILTGLAQAGMALFLAGTVVAGVAVGAIFAGSLATASRLAPAGQRGQAISAYFVALYCGLAVPVVGVGVATEFIGLFAAVLALSVLLAVVSVVAMAGIASGPASGRAVRPMTGERRGQASGGLRDPRPRSPGRSDAPGVPRPARRDTRPGHAAARRRRLDQAALHGVLAQIEALGLELLEVRRLPGEPRI